jgi:hypothetical protein
MTLENALAARAVELLGVRFQHGFWNAGFGKGHLKEDRRRDTKSCQAAKKKIRILGDQDF